MCTGWLYPRWYRVAPFSWGTFSKIASPSAAGPDFLSKALQIGQVNQFSCCCTAYFDQKLPNLSYLPSLGPEIWYLYLHMRAWKEAGGSAFPVSEEVQFAKMDDGGGGRKGGISCRPTSNLRLLFEVRWNKTWLIGPRIWNRGWPVGGSAHEKRRRGCQIVRKVLLPPWEKEQYVTFSVSLFHS